MTSSSKVSTTPPSTNPPALKKSTSGSQSSKDQKSILGFFQKRVAPALDPNNGGHLTNQGSKPLSNGLLKKSMIKASTRGSSQSLTPAPSSDAVEELDAEDKTKQEPGRAEVIGLPSPITPAAIVSSDGALDLDNGSFSFSSPSRKASTSSCSTILTS